MNRTKIEWTDYTWNPITGCTRGCQYCYARRSALRMRGRFGYPQDNPFRPTFHESRLKEPSTVKGHALIFLCSMGEFYDPGVPEQWRERIYDQMEKNPNLVFQILTKQRIIKPGLRSCFPKNMWIGITIDGTSDYWRKPLEDLRNIDNNISFISFEPLLGDVLPDDFEFVDWAIVGARTGPGARPPDKDLVLSLVDKIDDMGIPLFVKPNLRKYYPGEEWASRMEFPK